MRTLTKWLVGEAADIAVRAVAERDDAIAERDDALRRLRELEAENATLRIALDEERAT